MYWDDDRPAVGDAVAQHADARHGRSSTRARCCSRARSCRRGAARRGRSSCSARRGSTPSRSPPALNALQICRACTSGPSSSSRPSRSTRARRAAAARCTSPTGDAFRPVLAGVARHGRVPPQRDPSRFAWRQPPYEYEHDRMPIDILAGIGPPPPGHRGRRPPARDIAERSGRVRERTAGVRRGDCERRARYLRADRLRVVPEVPRALAVLEVALEVSSAAGRPAPITS